MDSLDYRILGELLIDASLSFVEIAKKLGTTPYTVRRRFERLRKEGIIQKSSVTIDLSKLGYQGKAFLLVTVSPHGNKAETIAYLRTIRNVIVVAQIIGPHDIIAIAPVTDLNSIQELVKEARKAPFLQRVEIACINDTNFPISGNLGTVLRQQSIALAKK
ncbi:MAG TPA: AsnC family transcriptional regulator [Candidatus Deferrimicrobiaceae bacterium]|nr:AsnC family transcriptional regulator [Candidatus Deferrimicrobiaceae bacterium]